MVTLKRSLKLQCKKHFNPANNTSTIQSHYIVCTGASSPLKNTIPLFIAKPPLNWQTVQAPPFQAITPSILVFCEPPLKVRSISEPQKYSFSSLIPSYLLKVTKSLGKLSQFEFLVMTENIFTYKLFLSFNISDFNLFFM